MHAGRRYTFKEFIYWTRRDIYVLSGLAIIPTVLFYFLNWKWLAIPWVPIALIGTAAAFIVGFRNTQCLLGVFGGQFWLSAILSQVH